MAKQKNKSNTPGILAVIIMIAALIIYFITNTDSVRTSKPMFEEKKFDLAYDYDDKPLAYSNGGKGAFICTRDSMKYISQTGNTQWQELFAVGMKEPMFIGNGKYAAVCDVGSNSLYMFSTDGKMYQKNFDGKILSMNISPGGYAVVIVKVNDEYTVLTLSQNGDEIGGYMIQENNIFPMGVAISENGDVFALSILDINGVEMESSIQLQYTNPYGGGIFYSKTYADELIVSLNFIDANHLVVMSDEALRLIQTVDSTTGRPSEKWEMPLTNQIDALECYGNKIIAVAYGNPLPNRESKELGTIEFFNLDLYSLGEYNFGKRIDYLKASGNFIIAGADKQFVNFNSTGKVMWEYNTSFEARDVVIMGKPDSALIIGALEAYSIGKP